MFNVQYHVRTADVVNSCFKEPHAIPDADFRDYYINDMMMMKMFHFVTEFRAESISSARATSFPSSENILY